MAERKQARNIFFDTFAEAYLNHYGLPYNAITADFVGLDQITNKGPLAPRMTLEVFQRGVANYFASELGAHTPQAPVLDVRTLLALALGSVFEAETNG